MGTCPYCKIDFVTNRWAKSEKLVCRNCRYYHEAETALAKDREMIELFKVYGSLPYDWDKRDDWR